MRIMGMLLFYAFNTSVFNSSRKMLKRHWFPRSEFPCRNIIWTCEHVVPKSLIPEHNDLHNLILLPDRLNNIRSNYPYIQGIGYNDLYDPNLDIKKVPACQRGFCSCVHLQGKLVSKKLFIPADPFKGMIGRSVLYMTDKYPHHKGLIHKRVLDLGVASIWDNQFPPTINEIKWNNLVLSHQGDKNPYVS